MPSVYTDLTNYFAHKLALTYQKMNQLAANDDYIKNTISNYRRPLLKFISVSLVDVENNTGTANETKILFPDGSSLSVTEDTASTTKYRRFDITATAEFTSGTEDSGLRSGLSEANNTWYAIYAVKSQIDATKFVLAGDTTLPIQANYSTLNTRYGTNSWVYLGMIRNGDGGSAAADILAFIQSGNFTVFKNAASGVSTIAMNGLILATTAGAATLTYARTSGTGATNIPNHVAQVIYGVSFAAVANYTISKDSGGTRVYSKELGTNGVAVQYEVSADEGVAMSNGGGTSIAQDIFLCAFRDNVLGVGSNPQI